MVEKVDLKYVKKRNKKKAAIIVSSITTGIVATFIIISFLGQRVGSFTIQLRQSNVDLHMSINPEFDEQTTYITVTELSSFDLWTNALLLNHDEIDNYQTDYTIGSKFDKNGESIVSTYYFKQTFYLRNTGTVPARYDFMVNILENNRPRNVTYGYDDLLRVRLYENSEEDLHEYTTYAKRVRNADVINYDDNGDAIYNETVAGQPGTSNYYGFAEMFENNDRILTRTIRHFEPGDTIRYTFLMWLEGNDPQSDPNGVIPEGGSLKIGIQIDGNEDQ